MSYSDMDRFKDALKGIPRDRVPLFPMIAGWAAANFSDFSLFSHGYRRPDLIVEAQIKAKESLGYDSLYAYADPLYVPEAFGCKVRFLETGPLVDPLRLSIASIEDVPSCPARCPGPTGGFPSFSRWQSGLMPTGRAKYRWSACSRGLLRRSVVLWRQNGSCA